MSERTAGVSTDELLDKRPRLRPDLLMSRELCRGPATVVLVKDRRTGRAFELAARERFILSRLDGGHSLADIGAQYAREFGRRLGPQHWIRLLWLLHERDLLLPPGSASADAATGSGTVTGSGARTAADRFVDRWARPLRWLAGRPALSGAVASVVVLFAAVAADLPALWEAARDLGGRPWTFAPVLAVVWLSAALHEFAHGLAARRYGCTIRRINLLTLTCTVEDYLYLPARGSQIAVAAVGGLANGLVLLPFGLAWFALRATAPATASATEAGPAAVTGSVLAAILLAGGIQTLVNYVPLSPLDGYKMVGHALGMLDLAAESRRFLRRRILRPLHRRPAAAAADGTAAAGAAAADRTDRATAAWLAGYGISWLVLVATIAAGTAYAGGRLLAGPLGPAAYLVSAAVVALTLAGWSARPARRNSTTINRSEDQP
jgi:putative peptide zinc metalloprotease protein